MPTESVHSYTDLCCGINRALQDYIGRIRIQENNVKLRDEYTEKLQRFENGLSVCNQSLAILEPMLKDTQAYIKERKDESMANINNAIRLAEEIIPDASGGVHFYIDDSGDAMLVTESGEDADLSEGGGFRQASAQFIKSVIAQSNPEILNVLILDEVFSLVSPENSARLSQYLTLMAENSQVISIEQKPQVYSNLDHDLYTFEKVGAYTEISKQHLSNGGGVIDTPD